MKGLIIKDLFCLRKQLRLFTFTVIGTFTLAIMFILSYNFGNIGTAFAQMQTEGEIGSADALGMVRLAMLLLLFIPMAFTGNVTDLFLDDWNASFAKLASAFPVSLKKRVAARYIAGLGFTLTGFVLSLILTVILSCLTEVIALKEYVTYLFGFAGILMIYLSLVIALEYLLGAQRSGVITILPFVGIVAGLLIPNYKAIREALTTETGLSLFAVTDAIQAGSYPVFGIAVGMLLISYGFSVFVAGRKGGIA